ncbi:MAG: cell division protein SepF [Clostridia bacterium]|jgi:cell division inhibitor SepF|nr:cell division protein SepF [Clostridia bacterium]MBO7157785.1 cell division protein SepF [Clostridia bacterium]MBQ1255273.1 cell division protein SepF [Clostridia bacterium]MBQ2254426.1 cell division protein SepF [Clostridia bacterium]MBQ5791840.1 cell division protein SepF [Clostridia bacterium]
MGFLGRINDMFKEDDSYLEEEENFNVSDENAEESFEEKAAPAAAAKSTGVGSAASLEMKVVKPERMDAAFGIGEHLLAKRTVVLNFEDTNKETVRRILDFLGGVVFAIEGNIKKVSDATYIVTPKHVDVTADVPPQAEAPKSRELF